jgi:hypothetical protein
MPTTITEEQGSSSESSSEQQQRLTRKEQQQLPANSEHLTLSMDETCFVGYGKTPENALKVLNASLWSWSGRVLARAMLPIR